MFVDCLIYPLSVVYVPYLLDNRGGGDLLVPVARDEVDERGPRLPEREFFIDNLLVRIHCIIVMISWTGLAPWEFPFST